MSFILDDIRKYVDNNKKPQGLLHLSDFKILQLAVQEIDEAYDCGYEDGYDDGQYDTNN